MRRSCSRRSGRRAEAAIRQRAKAEISPDELRDEYTQQLLKLVERKQEHHKDVVETDVEKQKPGKVVDLMEVLKKSKRSTESRVALLGPGDWFGEMSIVDIQPRSATVRARTRAPRAKNPARIASR